MERLITYQHGSTRSRIENIVRVGPDPHYELAAGQDADEGFSMADKCGPFPLGTAEDYAIARDRLNPAEGGPAILEIDLPGWLVQLGILEIPGMGLDPAIVQFDGDHGLPELKAAWPQLTKRILAIRS